MGKILSLLSLLRHFNRTTYFIRRPSAGWAGTPRAVASGGGRHLVQSQHGQGRAQFPGCYLGGSAKP